jgi:hypothetical protein
LLVAIFTIVVGVVGLISPDSGTTVRRLYFATPVGLYAAGAVVKKLILGDSTVTPPAITSPGSPAFWHSAMMYCGIALSLISATSNGSSAPSGTRTCAPVGPSMIPPPMFTDVVPSSAR